MGGVDVAVQVELQRGIDTDDAQAADDLGMIGDLLWAQDQFVLIPFQISEYIGVASARQGDRAAGGEAQLASVDQVKCRVLQDLGIHGQVFEGESISPHITALAMLPIPACNGPSLLVMRPAATSCLKKSIR